MDPRRERQVEIANAVKLFVNNEIIQSVFSEMDLVWWSDMKNNTLTPVEREFIRAKACALEDLWSYLKGLVDAGDLAEHDQALEDRPPLT